MLTINALSIDYGAKRVVEEFNLTLARDEILTLVGPTGCGKTTILQAVAGLVPIAGGEIGLGSWTANAAQLVPPEKRNIGMVFQDFALFPHLTVEENVSFRLQDSAPADHWINLLGLADFRSARPERLSGGQKQRVALARSLAHGPSLMLLDEPLSNLDAALKDSLRWEIRNALKEAGVPAIWVTHDQQEALSVGDRVGVLRAGHLEQLDTPEACYGQPVNRFVARFLGEASFLPATLTGPMAASCLGQVAVTAADLADGQVELLVRPADCSVTEADSTGNGELASASYEGDTWLYEVALDDGAALRVRAPYQRQIAPGARVSVDFINREPRVAFPAPAST
ncbi:MAG: ABC transporter ATP-binding protein [Pseudomonadota bacterium]